MVNKLTYQTKPIYLTEKVHQEISIFKAKNKFKSFDKTVKALIEIAEKTEKGEN